MGVLDGITSGVMQGAAALGAQDAANAIKHTAEVIGGAAQSAADNLTSDPVKAAKAAAVVVPVAATGALAASLPVTMALAAPVALSVGAGAVASGAAVYGGAAALDAIGVTHGARQGLEDAAGWALTHPGDVLGTVFDAEVLAAGTLAGGSAAGKLAGAIGNVLPPGAGGSSVSVPPPPPKITPPKPGASHSLAPSGLTAIAGASAPSSAPSSSAWPGLIPWLASLFRGER